MIDFDTPLEKKPVARIAVAPETQRVEIRQQITVLPAPSASKAYLAKPDEAWDWADLRDFVVAEIESRFGVFPRDVRKEAGIFKSFVVRYPDAVRIARHAFETADGYWMGAPISVSRFCKGSDAWFATPISERLASLPVKAW